MYRVWLDGDDQWTESRRVRSSSATMAAELACEEWTRTKWKETFPRAVTLWVATDGIAPIQVCVKPNITVQWDATELPWAAPEERGES